MMNRCFVVVCLVWTIYLTVEAQKLPEILQKCKSAENATDTDYMILKNNTKPSTKAAKCLGTCISENTGLIKNKTLNVEGTLAYVKTLPINSDKVQQSVKEILEECKGVKDPDRCEYGFKLMDCLIEGSKKRGIQSIYPQ